MLQIQSSEGSSSNHIHHLLHLWYSPLVSLPICAVSDVHYICVYVTMYRSLFLILICLVLFHFVELFGQLLSSFCILRSNTKVKLQDFDCFGDIENTRSEQSIGSGYGDKMKRRATKLWLTIIFDHFSQHT